MATRRMAAIVMIDVVGFSRMMADDEEGTLATLQAHRNATDPVILNYGGRIVKTTGDGVVVEAPSVVEAVRGAVETQAVMAGRNAELPPERRMQYRIGIHVGDVVVEDDGDVFGDAVNVAARLEALADPGGILISDTVHGHLGSTLTELRFEDRGEQHLKNIPSPVRTWAVWPRRERTTGTARPFSPETTLAVLPFDNMSADEEQEYFADGITEDLITALSHGPDLQVVARNSVFAFKGKPTDVRTVGRRLDARYVVEGSVRRAGDAVRITAQLIEAETGRHIWAERYDRELQDVFALQDEIVNAIQARVGPTVRTHEGRRLASADADSLDAWDLYQRARWHFARYTREDLELAFDLAERSLALAESAQVHFNLAFEWNSVGMRGLHLGERRAAERSRHHAKRAYELDRELAEANSAMALVEAYARRHDEAVALARRGVALNPHVPTTWTSLAHALYFAGDHHGSVEASTEAWRLGTHEPWRWHVATMLAFAHYLQGGYEAAVRWAAEALGLIDYLQAHVIGAAALGRLGRPEDAAPHLQRVRELRPAMSATAYGQRLSWKRPEDVEAVVEGLAAAGLPR